MSFQYGATVNKKKQKKKNRQQYSSQKFSKTVQNLLQHDGKKKYEVQKYTDSIENHFYVTINVDDNALHPEMYVSNELLN